MKDSKWNSDQIYLKNRCLAFSIFCMIFIVSCNKAPFNTPTQERPWNGVPIKSSVILDGYADRCSYTINDTVKIQLNTKQTIKNASIKLFSINGEIIDSVLADISPQRIQNTNLYENGYEYNVTFHYTPNKLKSGVYLWENKIPMLIKAVESKDITILYPSNTENAYSTSGGKSTYSTPQPARIVSFQRPISLSSYSLSFLQWIEKNKFHRKINYISDIDLENDSILTGTKLLIIVGHSEYWTRKARLSVDQFVDNGHNLLILSGNTMWWQVRYSEAKDQLICYKVLTEDPIQNPLLKTITWDQISLKYPISNSSGADFNHGGYGLQTDLGWDGYKICTNNSPLLEGTNLKKGDIISLPTSEYDGAYLKGFDSNGFPIQDNSTTKFNKSEIIGFDLGFRGSKTCGTFMVFQKTPQSGIIINTASTDWCSERGFNGKDGDKIKIITQNMIEKLIENQNVFSLN